MASGDVLSNPAAPGVSIPPILVEPLPAAWQAVLEQAGACFDGQGVSDFGKAEIERRQALSTDVMADLSHLGVIEAKGEDAQKFLLSLFTGDVRLVTAEKGLFTSWCDAKGRAQATFWLFKHDEAFYLAVPKSILANVLAGLKRYLLRVKVTLADASHQVMRMGLSGPGVAARFEALFGVALPTETSTSIRCGDCTVLAVAAGPFPRWLAFGSPEALAELWRALSVSVLPVGRETWTLLDILAGIPLLADGSSGEFIPQMLNMEALGGLCFTKGCYPGQEVIARLHYRGQLKRKLYLAYIDAAELPPPGARLEGAGATEAVGEVVSAARHPDGRVALLAVVKIEEKSQGPVRLNDAAGPELAFVE